MAPCVQKACDTGGRSFQNGGRGGANAFGSDGGFGGGGGSETRRGGVGVDTQGGGVQFSFSSGGSWRGRRVVCIIYRLDCID